MHPYVLVPLLTAVAAAALASAIFAREPGNRSHRLGALLVLCAGWWALCDVLWSTAPTRESALSWARWSSLGSLMLGPVFFDLFAGLQPGLEARLRRFVGLSYCVAFLCVLIAVASPGVVEDMQAGGWGWTPVLGPAIEVVFVGLLTLPLSGVVYWFRMRDPRRGRTVQRSPRVELAAALVFVVTTLTDFALPLAGLQVPRLGSTSIVFWGFVTWRTVYRFRDPTLNPSAHATAIFELLPEGVILVRLDGRIRSTNPKVGELAGCAARELLGRPIGELLPRARDAFSPSGGERECELVHCSGARLPVSVSESPLRDEEGEVVGYVLVLRDIREVASLRARLVTSGRLAAVGQLAAGIAHEINNPIAFIGSNVRLLESHWETARAALEKQAAGPAVATALSEGRELIDETCEGVERVAAIVRDVGGFSSDRGTERELADLRTLLDTAVRVAAPQLRGRAVVECRYGEIPLVSCVPQELMQVFLNLLLNAAQAFEPTGTIRLRTENQGAWVLVHVEDDGPGISPDVLAWIFDPFFTTKPVGQGTGLGLAISRQIVEKHGGSIQVTSEPAGGSAFRVRLPAPGETDTADEDA